MKLYEILSYVECEKILGDTNVEITGICSDSRKIRKGDLFICYKGEKCDTNDIIDEIIAGGAVAIVCERDISVGIPYAIVKNGRECIAKIARVFYGFADKKLNIIAVSGTNGKTTTTYMLKSIFERYGKSCGVIGTLGISYGDTFISPELTTPDPIFLHSVFADMYNNGVEYVFMEVSAHAIYYKKIEGIKFKVAIFTNCTQDHLDFFKTMKAYSECKSSFFKSDAVERCVINSDDELGVKLISKVKNPLSYGLNNPADTFAVDINERIDGSSFVVNIFDEIYDFNVNMPALHNVYNALGAATCARYLGVPINIIAEGLSTIEKVDGRLEHVAVHNGGDIFVDFAHTPDGLQKSLLCLKKLCKGDLFCVFGCGGNRDKTKRPIMGRVAAELSDHVIITSDNPRYEDPQTIISEISEGVRSINKKYVAITERGAAIEYAIKLMQEGDILLVAGKGGENYQEIMGIKHAYNDNTIIKNILSR